MRRRAFGELGTAIFSVLSTALLSPLRPAEAPAAVPARPQRLSARAFGDEVAIEVEGELFTRYKAADSQKYPYFFPILGPRSGTSVTTESSEPYPHHHSLFFACDRVNGGNYWQEGLERGRIDSVELRVLDDLGAEVAFEDRCRWVRPGAPDVFEDVRRWRISAPSANERWIEAEIELAALVDVRIEKTNHALFAARVPSELSPSGGGSLADAEGRRGEKETFGKEAAWCAFSGTRAGTTEGLAIFAHPENPWSPAPWFTRDYGFLSPTPMNWLGPEGLRLPRGSTVRLRYLAVVFGGEIAPARLDAIRAAWLAAEKKRSEFEALVPLEKRLPAAWRRSLFEKGEPETWRGDELRWIGMPVGGICAGQVYLGGDGALWHWDVFNRHIGTGDAHYRSPIEPSSPIDVGFALSVRAPGGTPRVLPLDRRGFPDVSFRGEYPIGIVRYAGPDLPVEVRLEAFSPFIPLSAEDSGLPAVVLVWTVRNATAGPLECELEGRIENAVCLGGGPVSLETRSARVGPGDALFVEHAAKRPPEPPAREPRPDVVFDDFERPAYDGWTVSGTAFGEGPIERARVPSYQGDVGGLGSRVVNSHATAPGGDVGEKDAAVGKLASREFPIERDHIRFFVGGGAHERRTCVRLLVEGKEVLSASGANDNRMRLQSFDVRPWAGKKARIEIVDEVTGPWGNVGADHIVFSDRPAEPEIPLEERPDYGTMGLLAFAGGSAGVLPPPSGGEAPRGERPRWAVRSPFRAEAGREATVRFAVVWHFPNLALPGLPKGRHYATRFRSAAEVAEHLARDIERLEAETRLWRETWYDSTLPWWFLDRTFANASTLATSTCHRLSNGRFWGWEGVGCCAGTCAHVWHYAHAVARLFPELERAARELGDYGAGFDPETGAIGFRAEHGRHWAADGQAGSILRAYREHQMSADGAFLRRLWPRVKKSLEFLIARDGDGDGILEGPQHNTLDADWYGQIAWLSGLYLAALRAGEEMAREMDDEAFASRCRGIFERGRKEIDARLFDGEIYIQIPDPKNPKTVGSYDGCEIDQVFGQSWAWQVGLGRILDETNVRTALRSLWRYNFAPDVGPYRKAHPPGRWYALPGEAGLILCTWPRGEGSRVREAFDFYFNECMNGFEYQAAGHMIAEGMVEEGLAIVRAIHDRYHPSRRNPYNEVECGDHYARSMASHGVFLAACGYEHHGPKGHLGFAPRIRPEDFRAAFTAAEGWGTFAQAIGDGKLRASVTVRWGRLALRTFSLGSLGRIRPERAAARVAGRDVRAELRLGDGRATLTFPEPVTVRAGESLEVEL